VHNSISIEIEWKSVHFRTAFLSFFIVSRKHSAEMLLTIPLFSSVICSYSDHSIELNELRLKINNKRGKKTLLWSDRNEKMNSKGTKEKVKCFCGYNKRFCGFHNFSLLVVCIFNMNFFYFFAQWSWVTYKSVSNGCQPAHALTFHTIVYVWKYSFFRSINESFILLLVVCTDMKNAHIFVVCSFWLR